MGDAATDELARRASRSLRSARRMTSSSVDGGGVTTPLFGEEACGIGGGGGVEGESSTDKQANALSRSLEW